MTPGRTGPSQPWIEFDALLEPLTWGRNVYTVLFVNEVFENAAATDGTRRVEGKLDRVEVNLGINRADVVTRPFVYVGVSLRRRLGAAAGDVVVCRLRPADPDYVPLPDDVRAALEEAGRYDVFQHRRPAERRRLLQPIENATREDTRWRHIKTLVRALPID